MMDITMYSDNELSLNVFNDEYLYNMRHSASIYRIIEDYFIYTPEQMTLLESDLIIDKAEVIEE